MADIKYPMPEGKASYTPQDVERGYMENVNEGKVDDPLTNNDIQVGLPEFDLEQPWSIEE